MKKCAESAVMTGSADGGMISMVLVVGGSIIGLIGGCLCFKRAGVGGIMQFIAAAMIVVSMVVVGGATALTVIALIFIALLIYEINKIVVKRRKHT